MDKSEVFAKLKTIVAPFCKVDNAFEKINESSRFFEDLQVNSARLVDIILDTEEQFNISIDDESADRMRTMSSAVAVVMEKIGCSELSV